MSSRQSVLFPEQRVGKVTHPAAYPGNRLLLTYSAGPVTKNVPPQEPWPDTGIYLISGVTTSPGEMELVINDPAYNEHLARVIVSYSTIYGREPVDLPWLPQTSPYLPPGITLRSGRLRERAGRAQRELPRRW